MHAAEPGFTLIELLIALAIAGVFAAFAVPSFESVLQRTRRSDVLVAAVQIQSAQERLHSRLARYGSLAEIATPATTPAGHYALQLRGVDQNGYELLATATGAQARDAGCRFMSVRVSGLDLLYASGPSDALANADAVNRRCWNS
ncbi:MAG TPA: type IV pilin protein [Burkholderiaceae bacterium]|jgi:type IV pilus assembly protein PilE